MEIKVVIASKYILGNPIATYSREECRVCIGHDPVKNEMSIIKIGARNETDAELKHESETYKRLRGIDQVPEVRYFGREDDRTILVLDRLGPSLEDLFDYCDRSLNISDLVVLALLLIGLIERIHRKNIVHYNLTPSHILVGEVGKRNTLHAISFCRAKVYDRTESNQNLSSTECEASVHANAFSSTHLHETTSKKAINETTQSMAEYITVPSPRDDLESILFILIYLSSGRLPWHDEQGPEEVMKKKMAMPIEDLCQHLPDEFGSAFRMVRALDINDEPNYPLLDEMFMNLAKRMNIPSTFNFSWITFQKKYFETTNAVKELLPVGAPWPSFTARELEIFSKAKEESRGRLGSTLRELRKI